MLHVRGWLLVFDVLHDEGGMRRLLTGWWTNVWPMKSKHAGLWPQVTLGCRCCSTQEVLIRAEYSEDVAALLLEAVIRQRWKVRQECGFRVWASAWKIPACQYLKSDQDTLEKKPTDDLHLYNPFHAFLFSWMFSSMRSLNLDETQALKEKLLTSSLCSKASWPFLRFASAPSTQTQILQGLSIVAYFCFRHSRAHDFLLSGAIKCCNLTPLAAAVCET